jgi:hypothetical protein
MGPGPKIGHGESPSPSRAVPGPNEAARRRPPLSSYSGPGRPRTVTMRRPAGDPRRRACRQPRLLRPARRVGDSGRGGTPAPATGPPPQPRPAQRHAAAAGGSASCDVDYAAEMAARVHSPTPARVSGSVTVTKLSNPSPIRVRLVQHWTGEEGPGREGGREGGRVEGCVCVCIAPLKYYLSGHSLSLPLSVPRACGSLSPCLFLFTRPFPSLHKAVMIQGSNTVDSQ